jgi:hypothetical protein
VGNDERSRSLRWLALATFALSSLMAGCGASGSTALTGHSVISGGKERRTASVKAAERSAGLTVMLTATPTHAKTGSPVEFNLTAYSPHAPGAFGYQFHYGDGTSAENVVPQFCVAGGGTPTRETWHLTHRYKAAGRYRVSASVYVNCTSDHATAAIAVDVT